MQEAPSVNEEVLVYAPKLSARGWFRAKMIARFCCRGFRWRIYDFPGRGNFAYMPRNWQPEAWRFIETEGTADDTPEKLLANEAADARQSSFSTTAGTRHGDKAMTILSDKAQRLLPLIPADWTGTAPICVAAGYFYSGERGHLVNYNIIYVPLKELMAAGLVEKRVGVGGHPRYTEYRRVPA